VDQLAEAERRLDLAKAAVDGAYQRHDWRAGEQAYAEQLGAERHLARVRGEQYAEPLDLGVRWDIGAPLPHVVSDSWRTIVIFHRPEPDPDWDGTYVRIVHAGQTTPSALGLVEFTGVYLTTFGGLNDEAIDGHPLSGRGLVAYQAHLVHNSSWIAEAERANSVHPQHRGGWYQQYNHYILCFHDETFECIAKSCRAEELHCSMAEALALAAAKFIGG
jgi:hypothetical protein